MPLPENPIHTPVSTRPECPVMSRQPGSPAARAACCRRRRMVSGWRLKTGVTASITASSGRTASRASTAAGPRYNTTPSASWSVFDSGIRMRPLPSPASSTSLQRRAAASETRSSPSRMTEARATSTKPRRRAYSAVSV